MMIRLKGKNIEYPAHIFFPDYNETFMDFFSLSLISATCSL